MSSINRCPSARNFAGDMLDGAVRFVSEPDLSRDLPRVVLVPADLRGRAFVFGTLVRARELGKYPASATISNPVSCAQIVLAAQSPGAALFVQIAATMIPSRFALFTIVCAFGSAACGSAPAAVETRPIVSLPKRSATREEEMTLITADSEVFAAVVRAQLRAGSDGYPLHIDELRYD